MSSNSIIVLTVLALAAPLVLSEHSNGYKIFGKVVRQYIKSQPDDILIGEGVHLVSSKSADRASRALSDDGTIVGAIENYLKSHELRIKLPELMPGEELGRSFKSAMDKVEKVSDNGTGRGRGGGGGGGHHGLALLGALGAKMMAALGIGGVGLLAMKALMVSALALMLAAIVGLKKLTHGHDEGGHHVIHATAHGHHEYRKKRAAAEAAYKGWEQYKRR